MTFEIMSNDKSRFFVEEIQTPATFDQLRAAPAGNKIRILVEYLVVHVTNPVLINALLSVLPIFTKIRLLINS